jgi:hypothetical protein
MKRKNIFFLLSIIPYGLGFYCLIVVDINIVLGILLMLIGHVLEKHID